MIYDSLYFLFLNFQEKEVRVPIRAETIFVLFLHEFETPTNVSDGP